MTRLHTRRNVSIFKGNNDGKTGFTIVELLIVIVVIAILAAISVVAYTGIQERSRNSKIESDLALLEKAIMAARINAGEQALISITGSNYTASGCAGRPAGTDLAALDKSTDSCWTSYYAALQSISDSASMDVTGLVDPWGRPYLIDENEREQTATYGPCGINRDRIAAYVYPANGAANTHSRRIAYVTPGC